MTLVSPSSRRTKLLCAMALASAAGLALSACGSSGGGGSSSPASSAGGSSASSSGSSASGASSSAGSASGASLKVALILKDNTNPYFVAMAKGAKADAAKENVSLTIVAGKNDGDTSTQINLVENAIAAGDKGILIVPNGPGVFPAITKARKADLFVIALDTPPDPTSLVDITFATDNFEAGKLIGEYAAKRLAGKPAVIASW